jgi:hypothetical protein
LSGNSPFLFNRKGLRLCCPYMAALLRILPWARRLGRSTWQVRWSIIALPDAHVRPRRCPTEDPPSSARLLIPPVLLACALACGRVAPPPPFHGCSAQTASQKNDVVSSRERHLHAAFSFSGRGEPGLCCCRERAPAMPYPSELSSGHQPPSTDDWSLAGNLSAWRLFLCPFTIFRCSMV